MIRTAIKAIRPNTSTLARIKINELPQIAARLINNSVSMSLNMEFMVDELNHVLIFEGTIYISQFIIG